MYYQSPAQLRAIAVDILKTVKVDRLDSFDLAYLCNIPEPVAATVIRESNEWKVIGHNDGPVTFTKFERIKLNA